MAAGYVGRDDWILVSETTTMTLVSRISTAEDQIARRPPVFDDCEITCALAEASPVITLTPPPGGHHEVFVSVTLAAGATGSFTAVGYESPNPSGEVLANEPTRQGDAAIALAQTGHSWRFCGAGSIVLTGAGCGVADCIVGIVCQED